MRWLWWVVLIVGTAVGLKLMSLPEARVTGTNLLARSWGPPNADPPTAPNLLQNPSFEHNWFNRAFAMNRRFLLLQASDLGVGEADGHIDHWRFEGIPIPDSWDLSVAHSGSRSVRFERAGRGLQLVRFAGETHWPDGGAQYNYFLPMERNLAAQLARRPIVVGAWCKTSGVPVGGEPQLTVSVECGVRPNYECSPTADAGRVDASVSFSAGTHEWEHREVKIDTAQLKGTPFLATVGIVSPGKGGTVSFDDVTCVEQLSPDQPNRVANAGIEALDREGWPRDWLRPARWTWFRQSYYSFTGWSHEGLRQIRGGAVVDRMVSFRGTCSLRFSVLPGDNFAVASRPIDLNQDRPRPLEVRAMVKADNLRTLEIMAMDQNGQWLPQGDLLGADMEEPGAYNMGSTGAGTYDWLCVRKYFSPRTPVRSLRLFLCARGFDGAIVEKNRVGTLWWDDVQLFEHGVSRAQIPSGSIPNQPEAAPAVFPFRVRDIDLGDRLWGQNTVRVTMELDDRRAVEQARSARLRLLLTDPSGVPRSSEGQTVVVQPQGKGRRPGYAVATAKYEVKQLCRSWTDQYRLSLQLDLPRSGAQEPRSEFVFGTPSRLITPGVSAYYSYPDEPLLVYANLNVSRNSFPSLSRLDIVAARGEREIRLRRLTDFSRVLRPTTAPQYIDTDRLVAVKLRGQDFTVHPWSEPVRDTRIVVRLTGRTRGGERLLAESDPIRFGFISHFPPPDFPEVIRKTAVNENGFLTINGKVYFPVFWTPHFGICPEADYPPRLFHYKTLDLTEIVYSKRRMPDDEVKARLLARVNEVKDDPRFFQYELGEGEMQLQEAGWVERNEWLKRAMAWIRAADPNHIISGPESWLVGHPGHNRAMQAFVPQFDVIGVETSFEQTPQINTYARPLMRNRRTAVLAGLETYFYQPNEVLRWRGYRSLLDGAAGVGLCPSGMLQARPDKVNYLRGLNGEFRGLAPAITADAPTEKLSVSSPLIDTMERLLDGKRYVVAVRNKDRDGPLTVRFDFPEKSKFSRVKVRFEDRILPSTAGGFEDRFDAPQTVHVYELEQEKAAL